MNTKKKIAVIGSINMDLVATADRVPLHGETLTGHTLEYIPGGKGENQAVAAARLGADVEFYGAVGDDGFGKTLKDNLLNNNVEASHLLTMKDAPSGIALITVAENDNTILVIQGANKLLTPDYLQPMKSDLLKADILVIQNEIPEETVLYACKLFHSQKKTIIYNPAPILPLNEEIYACATFVTPNEHEALELFPDCKTYEEVLKKGNGKVIITLGDKGAACVLDGEIVYIPARKAKVVDTTGAGDTFNGALAYFLSEGKDIKEALLLSNTAASISTEKMGAQGGMPSLEKVMKEAPVV